MIDTMNQNKNSIDGNILNTLHGGKLIDQGGFGCVFKPSLDCGKAIEKNTSKFNDSNNISKLLIKNNALIEYNLISKLKKKIDKIPNHNNYFILDLKICTPGFLSHSDLHGYHKCNALIKRNITKKNINNNLNSLKLINMKDGGHSLSFYIKNKVLNPNNFITLNNKLINLYKNAIFPLKNLGIIHHDIKPSNLLYKNDHFKIIDWGISIDFNTELNNDKNMKKLSYDLSYKLFNFNNPFSTILLEESFLNYYKEFLLKNKNPTKKEIDECITKYIKPLILTSGHFTLIIEIFYNLFFIDIMNTNKFNTLETTENNETTREKILYEIKNNVFIEYIVNYLSDICFKYTQYGVFQLNDYLKDIYVKIVDLWGFITCYLLIYEYFIKYYEILGKNEFLKSPEYKITLIIKNIIVDMFYKNSLKVIDSNLVLNNLEVLNSLFPNVNTKLYYSSNMYVTPYKIIYNIFLNKEDNNSKSESSTVSTIFKEIPSKESNYKFYTNVKKNKLKKTFKIRTISLQKNPYGL
jgi:hypothetical protein